MESPVLPLTLSRRVSPRDLGPANGLIERAQALGVSLLVGEAALVQKGVQIAEGRRRGELRRPVHEASGIQE